MSSQRLNSSMRYQFENLSFDADTGRLTGPGGKNGVTLRPQVARLLQVFLDNPNQVLDRDTLCKAVWDEGTVVDFESGLAAVLRELRRSLAEQGGKEDLIETIPRRGYRLKLDPAAVRRDQAEAPLDRGQVRRGIWGAAAFAAVVLLILSLFWPTPVEPPSDEGQAPGLGQALAILPFEVLAGTDMDPEGAGILLADYLLTELWQNGLDEVSLIGRTSLLAYRDRTDIAAAVAEDLGVNLLLEGSISQADEEWRIDARLLQIPPGTVRWSERLTAPANAPLPVAELAEALVTSLRETWHDPD
ncbi:MAG: hypothetical protein EA370_12115 [Wenzhouxiangella sp.]|nr:MAG: hypothetical protein EA370_12115 [Wenzhouxiangella sp.]